MAEGDKNRIQIFDSNGNFLKVWGSWGYCYGYFRVPIDLAIDLTGNLYVLEYGNRRIQKFMPNSNLK